MIAFRAHGHLVFGAIREIGDLLGVPHSEAGASADVTGVGRTRRVPASKCFGHRGIPNRSLPRAIAHSLELAIPAGDGQPHFDLDVRVARGRQRRRDTAERGQTRECLTWPAAPCGRTRRCERARCHFGRHRDFRIREIQRRYAFARCRGSVGRRPEAEDGECRQE